MIFTLDPKIPRCISWGESYDIDSFSYTVQLGSNEQISNGVLRAKLVIGDYDKWAAAESEYGDYFQYANAFGREFQRSGDEHSLVAELATRSTDFSIAKGKSVTFTASPGTMRAPDDDVYVWKTTSPQRFYPAKTWLIDKFPEIETDRRIPVTLIARAGDSSHYYYYVEREAFYFLNERIDPEVDSIVLTDTDARDAQTYFGDYVQNVSCGRITCAFTLDPLDPTLTAHHTLTITDHRGRSTTFENDTAAGVSETVFDIGLQTMAGTFTYSYTVTDNHGNSATETGAFDVLAYTGISLEPYSGHAFFERYSESRDEHGEWHYAKDELGTKLWTNVVASVGTVSGNDNFNACELMLTWTDADGHDQQCQIQYSANGMALNVCEDRRLWEVRTRQFPAGLRFNFTLTLSDWFHQGDDALTITGIVVEKGTGYFNVEKYGTAVGKLSTGTQENPKFESAYRGYFEKGIEGVGEYSGDEHMLLGCWIDGSPLYEKTFSVSAAAGTSSAASLTVGSIPSGVKKIIGIRGIKRASNGTVWPLPYYYSTSNFACVNVENNGNITLRHNDGSTAITFDAEITITYTKMHSGDIVDVTPVSYTASSDHGASYVIANAFDGNSGTAWMTAETGQTPVGYVTIQLPTNVDHISVSCWSRTHTAGGAPSHVKAILGSANGTWDGDSAEAETDGNTKVYEELCNLELENTTVYPWLKIELTKGNQAYAGFAEIFIKGKLL